MKKFKKSIVALSLSTIMLAIAGLGTLAYFTDTETASNSFTVGKVDIGLEEEKWDEENGKDITPGREIPKDPTVTVEANSVDSYVRMTMTMPSNVFGASNLDKSKGEDYIIFEGMDTAKWGEPQAVTTGSSITLIYDYKEIVTKSDTAKTLAPLFTSVKIADQTTNQVLEDLGNFDIVVGAYALQVEGFKVPENYDTLNDAFNEAFNDMFK